MNKDNTQTSKVKTEKGISEESRRIKKTKRKYWEELRRIQRGNKRRIKKNKKTKNKPEKERGEEEVPSLAPSTQRPSSADCHSEQTRDHLPVKRWTVSERALTKNAKERSLTTGEGGGGQGSLGTPSKARKGRLSRLLTATRKKEKEKGWEKKEKRKSEPKRVALMWRARHNSPGRFDREFAQTRRSFRFIIIYYFFSSIFRFPLFIIVKTTLRTTVNFLMCVNAIISIAEEVTKIICEKGTHWV